MRIRPDPDSRHGEKTILNSAPAHGYDQIPIHKHEIFPLSPVSLSLSPVSLVSFPCLSISFPVSLSLSPISMSLSPISMSLSPVSLSLYPVSLFLSPVSLVSFPCLSCLFPPVSLSHLWTDLGSRRAATLRFGSSIRSSCTRDWRV